MNPVQKLAECVKRWPKLSAVVVLAALGAIVLAFQAGKPKSQAASFYQVRKGDFLVSVVEGGTLEAVNEVSIRSEVEGTARIIFIVPEGSYVKKGDLLVELDASTVQDSVNQQQINVEKAEFALVQSEQQLAIQKSVVDSEIQAATLKVEFAQTDLNKFEKGEALQIRRDAEIKITNVVQTLQIAEERLQWSEKLFKEGFETKANLDKDRLTVSQTKLQLEQAEKALWMIDSFDNPKQRRALESALEEAQDDLERVKLQGERKLAQFVADVETQKKTYDLSVTKLEREKKQLLASKVYAPQDGLVVYGSPGGGHFSSESMIEEGAVVRNRQEIIKLPDVSTMKVQVKIHETHIAQVRIGQPAFVVLDSMPDQRFRGVVRRVAPLPDSSSRWGNPDLKLYATEVHLTEKLPDIKPGVSARAEIVITNLSDVLSVPIQAVTTRGGKPVVFLADSSEAVPVTVGMFNTKFIEVTSGLKDGDRVLLAPPFDSQERDLAGTIIADKESLPSADTNAPAIPLQPIDQNGSGIPPIAAGGSRLPGGAGRPDAVPNAGPEGTPGANATEAVRRFGEATMNGGTNRARMREEFMKRFDTDGDGTLSDSERAAMRDAFPRSREGGSRPDRSGKRGPGSGSDESS